MKSKEAYLEREDMSEKVECDQYVVFAEQRRLDDLNYSEDSMQGQSVEKASQSCYGPAQCACIQLII